MTYQTVGSDFQNAYMIHNIPDEDRLQENGKKEKKQSVLMGYLLRGIRNIVYIHNFLTFVKISPHPHNRLQRLLLVQFGIDLGNSGGAMAEDDAGGFENILDKAWRAGDIHNQYNIGFGWGWVE